MTQNERDTRLARMEELLREIMEIKRKRFEGTLEGDRLIVFEHESTLINEYHQHFTIEIIYRLPIKIPNLVESSDFQINQQDFTISPADYHFNRFLEIFESDSADNKKVLDTAIEIISKRGLTIDFAARSLIYDKQRGESK